MRYRDTRPLTRHFVPGVGRAECSARSAESKIHLARNSAAIVRRRLLNLCPKCGIDNPPGKRFCGELRRITRNFACVCARSNRIDLTQIRVAESPAAESLEGERKTVTALFADIKGSMELMEDLDPEEARAIVDPALKLMIDAVASLRRLRRAVHRRRHLRAVRRAGRARGPSAARALRRAPDAGGVAPLFGEAGRRGRQFRSKCRVGVNTGEVVVRSITTGERHTEYTPIGHTTSLASRMQALAPTGSIAVTEQTRKLCEGYFVLKPLGPTKVKGVSEPVNVYEVIGLGPLRTRLQARRGAGFTKFVGREREMEALKHAVELAQAGHGQIVAAVAEPGVGKSRLFYEFKARSQSGWMVLEAFSVSHGKASAYLPVIDLLHELLRDHRRRRRAQAAREDRRRVLALDRALEDTLPYLFACSASSKATIRWRRWTRSHASGARSTRSSASCCASRSISR